MRKKGRESSNKPTTILRERESEKEGERELG